MTGKLYEVFKRTRRQWVAPEMPDVAPPDQKIAQPRSESFVESDRLIGNQDIFSASPKAKIAHTPPCVSG